MKWEAPSSSAEALRRVDRGADRRKCWMAPRKLCFGGRGRSGGSGRFGGHDGERTGGSGVNPSQAQDAFVGGYIADMDYANRACWAEVCKTHAGQGY